MHSGGCWLSQWSHWSLLTDVLQCLHSCALKARRTHSCSNCFSLRMARRLLLTCDWLTHITESCQLLVKINVFTGFSGGLFIDHLSVILTLARHWCEVWLEYLHWWFTDAFNLSGYMCTDGRACPVWFHWENVKTIFNILLMKEASNCQIATFLQYFQWLMETRVYFALIISLEIKQKQNTLLLYLRKL